MDARCASCGAAVRAGAPWCTLCYTPLAAAQVSVPAQRGERGAVPATSAPSVPPSIGVAPLSNASGTGTVAFWPCHACGAQVAIERQECPACGARFLDPAAQATHRTGTSGLSGSGTDPLRRLAGMPRGGRLALGLVLGLLLALIVPVLLALLGA